MNRPIIRIILTVRVDEQPLRYQRRLPSVNVTASALFDISLPYMMLLRRMIFHVAGYGIGMAVGTAKARAMAVNVERRRGSERRSGGGPNFTPTTRTNHTNQPHEPTHPLVKSSSRFLGFTFYPNLIAASSSQERVQEHNEKKFWTKGEVPLPRDERSRAQSNQ